MTRADRRRFDREFSKLMKAAPDDCMVCGTQLEHNCKTFGGLTAQGVTVLAGECCARKIEQMVQGVYVNRNLDGISHLRQGGKVQPVSAEVVTSAIGSIQSHFSKLDEMSNALMRQGGVHAPASNVHLADSLWKADDAAWFEDHPDRSHRLRPMLEGEAATVPAEITTAVLPEKHRLDMLIRQIDVGKRMRTIFCRNTEVAIPDSEEVIHAIFDLVTERGRKGVVSSEEIVALARKYGAARSENLH
jgi:hypothetical protein